jgi:hypothetical protein
MPKHNSPGNRNFCRNNPVSKMGQNDYAQTIDGFTAHREQRSATPDIRRHGEISALVQVPDMSPEQMRKQTRANV